jgi:beta-glucanase (GH16 family)
VRFRLPLFKPTPARILHRRHLRDVLARSILLPAALLAPAACAFSNPGAAQSSGVSSSGSSTSGGNGTSGAASGSVSNGSSGTSAGAGASGQGASGSASSGTVAPSGAMTGSGTTSGPDATTTSGSTSSPDAGSPGDAGSATGSMDAETITDAGAPPGWVLWWSDEFTGAAGTPPSAKYWGYDLGGGGWGLGQLQTYTNNTANAALDGKGNLAIVAIQDAQGNFTSARIKTQGKVEHLYGRFEIRAKVLSGNGLWPAFWMLGNNFPAVPWPNCGEIDIMEMIGSYPYTNGGSLHGPGYSGMHPLNANYTLPDGGPSLADDFHVYAIEWETNVVRFYVDNNLYETRTPADVLDAGATQWVYDHPFFMLLNLGVGGRHAGPPTGTVFPQTLLVDYVRVYQRPNAGG